MFGILKLGTRPQGGESKRSADNFGHCNLFDICDLRFGISYTLADSHIKGRPALGTTHIQVVQTGILYFYSLNVDQK